MGAEPSEPGRHLSLGDAATIAALLAFAVGWVVLYAWSSGDGEIDTDMGALTAALLLLTIFGPPVWAMKLVTSIVRRP